GEGGAWRADSLAFGSADALRRRGLASVDRNFGMVVPPCSGRMALMQDMRLWALGCRSTRRSFAGVPGICKLYLLFSGLHGASSRRWLWVGNFDDQFEQKHATRH